MPERAPAPVTDPGMRYVLIALRRSLLGVVAAIDLVTKEEFDPARPPRREEEKAA